MSGIARCPECGKVISTRFPLHNCVKQVEKFDRLNAQVTVTFNKPVTEKAMHALLVILRDRFEQAIAEDPKLTERIGHVIIGSPLGVTHSLEICP